MRISWITYRGSTLLCDPKSLEDVVYPDVHSHDFNAPKQGKHAMPLKKCFHNIDQPAQGGRYYS